MHHRWTRDDARDVAHASSSDARERGRYVESHDSTTLGTPTATSGFARIVVVERSEDYGEAVVVIFANALKNFVYSLRALTVSLSG